LLGLGIHARVVDADSLCIGEVLDTAEYSSEAGPRNLKRAAFAVTSCSSDLAVDESAAVRTRVWGLVTGAPFHYGNAEFSVESGLMPSEARHLEICDAYAHNTTLSDVERENAGIACLFGVPTPGWSGSASQEPDLAHHALQRRTQPVRRLTCKEVNDLASKNSSAQSSPCSLAAIDIAQASYFLGHVPIIITDAPFVATSSEGSTWSAMSGWRRGLLCTSFTDVLAAKSSPELLRHTA